MNPAPPPTDVSRVLNFAAGPAVLPEAVLERLQAELPDWQGTGQSVLELGHRSDAFQSIADQAETDLRHLLDIPPDYAVLFLHGPVRAHYPLLAMNLLDQAHPDADYLLTGYWSRRAAADAPAHILADNGPQPSDIPEPHTWQVREQAAYLYYCDNETIDGIRYPGLPAASGVPRVCDMTSSLLTRPLNIRDYGLILAGAQKNFGIAGLVVVIVNRDLLAERQVNVPEVFDYRAQDRNRSLSATPPTWAWYVAGQMFAWIRAQGGLREMAARRQQQSGQLYGLIDELDLYRCRIHPRCRSLLNVCFDLREPALQQRFLQRASDAGLLHLAGHRSRGGLRASLYTAMPMTAVARLCEFMREFERTC